MCFCIKDFIRLWPGFNSFTLQSDHSFQSRLLKAHVTVFLEIAQLAQLEMAFECNVHCVALHYF